MLYDPGANKSLLPNKLFPSTGLKKKFRSATGHPIKATDPKLVNLEVNGSSLPIKIHINDQDLSILGRQFTKKCSVVTDGKQKGDLPRRR